MTRTGSSFGKLKSSSWNTFPLDDKEWPLKKESFTKTECSWFFNSRKEPFDRCVFQDLSENPILLHAPVAQLDRATDSGSVGRAFESLRVHQISTIYSVTNTDTLFSYICVIYSKNSDKDPK